MVGKAVFAKLRNEGYKQILQKSSRELDLKNAQAVETFFERERPEYVIHLAARVGGIWDNINHPAEFLFDNLLINSNVIHSAYKYNVIKLLNLSSSCVYPRECTQPMKEDYLLKGSLEPTNEGYALAKITALKMCEYYNKQYSTNFITISPPNLFGPNDHFNSERSHVISALISKFHSGRVEKTENVSIWGTGTPRREFLYVDDLADVILFIMENIEIKDIKHFINVGPGSDLSIKELALIIKDIVGFEGSIIFDTSKPDGMPRKIMDVSHINRLGWEPRVDLKQGLKLTYQWYLENQQKNTIATR